MTVEMFLAPVSTPAIIALFRGLNVHVRSHHLIELAYLPTHHAQKMGRADPRSSTAADRHNLALPRERKIAEVFSN
jgi:hypothetical protein